jgi:hypothetical protein
VHGHRPRTGRAAADSSGCWIVINLNSGQNGNFGRKEELLRKLSRTYTGYTGIMLLFVKVIVSLTGVSKVILDQRMIPKGREYAVGRITKTGFSRRVRKSGV